MISNVMGSSVSTGMQMPPPRNNEQKLSDDHRELISATLSKFDSETLTEEYALSIISAFQDAGVEPGREMAELMSEAGFDAKELGDLAGVEGSQGSQRPLPPPSDMQPGSLNMSSEVAEDLNSLMDQYFSDNITSDEKESILTAMQTIFAESAPETGLINQYA